MIERIIQFSIKNKIIVGLFIIALIGSGLYSLSQLPIDAIPDSTNNQVQIISLAPSLAVQEVESFITAPIEVSIANIPDIIELRSISRLGLSVISVVFKDNVDIYWARQQLSERLKEAEENIPTGLAKIELAPISTGLGEIYQYRLAVDKRNKDNYSPMELRTLQDWVVRREMLGTPGIAEINSYGGFVKQYEVALNPERLKGMNVTVSEIIEALKRNNENTGSAYIDKNPTAYFIRGIGLVKTLEDVGKIVVKNNSSGTPILINDVATVQFGAATRYGALVVDTTEAVGGVIMMLKGANAHQVIENVENRIQTIQKSLPEGVSIEPFLNRSDLVGRAINTVSTNLIEGALIVIFILVLLLGNFRAGLIVASVIPLAMLFAVSLMHLFGVSGNLMSLGAIDFGLIVDGAVIIVESVVHRITKCKTEYKGIAKLSQNQMDDVVFKASSRIRKAATFGEIIILIVYMPILFLVGIEGKMFTPMAQVVVFAILGAFILSLTYVPMASALFLSKSTEYKQNYADTIMNWFHKAFNPIIKIALKNKKLFSIATITLFIVSLFIFSSLGGEFIPELEEGDLAAGVMTLQGGSLTNTVEIVKKANKILLDSFPEVKHTVCKIGAGEIPTDPTPMETGDYIITLKEKSEWTSAKTREELVEKMQAALIPLAGVKFEFQQPIQMRFNELISGSRQDIAIKIFGDDLTALTDKASEIEKIIKNVNGVEDINVEKVTGLAQVQIEYDRDRLAQYGLSVDAVNQVLRTAFAGSKAGVIFDGEKRYSLVVRFDKDYRQKVEDINNLSVSLPNGHNIPLEMIAKVEVKSGPAQVSRENTKRRITIGFNVRNRDIQSVIEEVSSKIDTQIKLPTGYYINYGGEFQHLEAAKNRLAIAVPIALLLIIVLLFFTFKSLKQSLLIFTAVPMSAIGGILALWLRGMNFSISAGVGFIALFGVAVLNGIVLIAEFNRLEKEGVANIEERVKQGLHTRLRPVIITAAVASLGFLPMALSSSAGAEVQKPLATVVIGGLISATFLTLVILPLFYIAVSNRKFNLKFNRKNNKQLITIIIAAVFTCISSLTKAQKSIILDSKEAIRIALNNNITLNYSATTVDVQKALKGSAWNIPKTNIQGQLGQFNSYAKDNSFTISQSFEFPTVYINQNKLAKKTIETSEWEYKSAQLEITTQVKQFYWQLVYLHSKQKLYQWQDTLYNKFFKAAEIRMQSGETNRLEFISARSQSMELKNQLQQINVDLLNLNLKLQTLLNIYSPILLADSVLTKIEFLPSGDSSSIRENPAIAKELNNIKVSRIESKLESSKMLPEISLGYFSQTMIGSTQNFNGVPRIFNAGDRFSGFQVGISVPLFFGSYISAISAAKLKEKSAEFKAQHIRKSYENGYKTLLADFYKYQNSLNYYEQQALREADIIIDQATKSYKAGAMDYLDYIQNISRTLSIKLNYLDGVNNYNQTVILIENMIGK